MARLPVVTPEQEAERLLRMYGGPDHLARCVEFVRHQFDVIQTRSQLLLTLGTLVLTITGFSGPKIAQTNDFARITMAAGIAFVLAAMVILLLGGLRIHWVSQLVDDDPLKSVTRILRYRNRKTRLFFLELALLVIGLASYVASVITYLTFGA